MSFKSLAAGVIAAAAAAAMSVPALAATVTIGTGAPGYSGNCYPFSCFAGDYGGSTFQEIYSGSAFGGPVKIDSASFFFSGSGAFGGNGEMDSASYHVTFWTSSLAPGGLTNIGALNVGAQIGDFGTVSFGGPMPSTLTISGAPFLYNPAAGNLVMQVDVTGLTQAVGYQSFFQNDVSGATQRYWAYNGSPVGSLDYLAEYNGALVTSFDVSPVPEPAEWTLLLLGVGALGAALRTRRRAALAV
jgi:hypothetical protein